MLHGVSLTNYAKSSSHSSPPVRIDDTDSAKPLASRARRYLGTFFHLSPHSLGVDAGLEAPAEVSGVSGRANVNGRCRAIWAREEGDLGRVEGYAGMAMKGSRIRRVQRALKRIRRIQGAWKQIGRRCGRFHHSQRLANPSGCPGSDLRITHATKPTARVPVNTFRGSPGA